MDKGYKAQQLDITKALANGVSDDDLLLIGNIGQLSASGDALLTTNYADDYGVQGYEWKFNDVEALAASTAINFLIDLSAVPANTGVFIQPIALATSETEVQIRIYEDTDYAGGVAETPVNINRVTQQDKTFVVTKGATGTDKGDLLSIHSAFGSSGVAGSVLPAKGGSSSPLILDTTKNYLIEIENLDASATRIEYDAPIFEIPFS